MKGRKTGGRKPGSLNKNTQAVRERVSSIKASGKDPMSFFLSILRDDNYPHVERKEAATQLLPYFHPKLTSIEARSSELSHEDRLQRLLAMMEDTRSRDAGADAVQKPNDPGPYPLIPYQEPQDDHGVPTPRGGDEVPGKGRGGDGAP